MAKFHPPESLDFTRPEQWPEWRQRFLRYRLATKLTEESGTVQVSTLLYALGREAEQVFSTFVFGENEEDDNYDTVLDKLNTYFVPKVNIIHERARFHLRVQKQGESAEEYIRTLYELAETCQFGGAKVENIRDRLVIGILDIELSEKLQLTADLTLDRAVEMVRQSEQIKGQVSQQAKASSTDASYLSEVARKHARASNPHAGGGWKQQRGGNRKVRPPAHQDKRGERNCFRCGKDHPKQVQCVARNAQCRNCQKIGHFAAVCKSAKVNELVNVRSEHEASLSSGQFLGEIKSACKIKDSTTPWTVKLHISNTPVTFKIDTGADTSVISEDTYHKLKHQPALARDNTSLDSPGGKLNCLGLFNTTVKYAGQYYKFTIHVIRTANGSDLLGRNVAVAMGLVKRLNEIQSTFDAELGLLKVKPVKIRLREEAVPYSVSTARRVSAPLFPKVRAELERMVGCGVIEEVKEPTEWCAPMVPVPKKSGEVRICVDLKRLNTAVKRERYVLPTIDDILPRLADSRVFSLLDAASGFWQIPLDRETAKLTTFITPLGRYFFKRLPFGIASASEIFQREMSVLFRDQEGVEVFMDDILVHGKDENQHEERLQAALRILRDAGLKLNEGKCRLRQKRLTYLGHCIDKEGIRPDPSKVSAIMEMQAPSDVPGLRRFLGMVHYLGRYLPSLSDTVKPLNDLLKSDVAWTWDTPQAEAFSQVKHSVCTAPTLAFYDINKPTIVSADASSYGLGSVLLQRHTDGLKPVAFCSRTLTDSETRYAQIEKECLAAVWACERFSHYLYGLENFTVHTDHKPLVPLINNKDLDTVPLRCQRLLMRLMKYNPTAEYVPGKTLTVADTLSRQPLPVMQNEVSELTCDVSALEDAVHSAWPVSPSKLERIKHETSADYELQVVKSLVLRGWPDHVSSVPVQAKAYHQWGNSLSVSKGLVLYGERIVIPHSMRHDILNRLHDGHQGITKCKERARMSVWWPGLEREIQDLVTKCPDCLQVRPTQRKEPLMTTQLPARPWQRIAADICEYKKQNYLIVIDYFSRYLEIAHLPDMTSQTTCARLKNIFARWGCPDELYTDNGGQFASKDFRNFSESYDFTHITSSPHYPQSNGEAERAVQTAKRILRQADPFLALMSYRATPLQATGASPAQLMLGRQIKTTVPTLDTVLSPKWPDFQAVRQADARAKEGYRRAYNRRHGARELPPLNPGASVALKLDNESGWTTTGTVQSNHPAPRSYLIQTGRGVLRRNRRHLRPTFDSARQHGEEETVQVSEQQPGEAENTQASVHPTARDSPQKETVSAEPAGHASTRMTSRGRVIRPPERLKDFVVGHT